MNDWQSEAQRLVRRRVVAEPGRFAALWAEVEAEAWDEVRAVLKAEMVTALLEKLGQQVAMEKHVATATSGQGGDDQPQAAQPSVLPDPPLRRLDVPMASLSEERVQPVEPSPSTVLGFYVYGIVDCTGLASLPVQGVTAGYPITLLPHRELAAVVSAAPLDEWGEEPLKANLGDMTWLESRVRGHQAVLDAILPLATLIPMKFATVYLDPSGVERFLVEHYEAFITLLGNLRGRQEWGLKLYCDNAILAAHLGEISPAVAQLRAEIAHKPKGAAYLLARRLQEISDSEGEQVGLAVADRIHAVLAERSVAATLNPLQSSEATGRGEQMLLNAAYLVDEGAHAAFRAALCAIAAEHNGRGFLFELSGPWPAYNFAALPLDESMSCCEPATTSGT